MLIFYSSDTEINTSNSKYDGINVMLTHKIVETVVAIVQSTDNDKKGIFPW